MGSGRKAKGKRRTAQATKPPRKTSPPAKRPAKAAGTRSRQSWLQRPTSGALLGTALIVLVGVVALIAMQSIRLSVPVRIEARELGSPTSFEAAQGDGNGIADMGFVAEVITVDPEVAGTAVDVHLPVHPRRCSWLAAQMRARCEDGVVQLPELVHISAESPMSINTEGVRFESLNVGLIRRFPGVGSATPPPAGVTTANNLAFTRNGVGARVSLCSWLPYRTTITVAKGPLSSEPRTFPAGPWSRSRQCSGLTVRSGTGPPTDVAQFYIGDVDMFTIIATATNFSVERVFGSVTIDGERHEYSDPGPPVDLSVLQANGLSVEVSTRSRVFASQPEVLVQAGSSHRFTIDGTDARPTAWEKHGDLVTGFGFPGFTFFVGIYFGALWQDKRRER